MESIKSLLVKKLERGLKREEKEVRKYGEERGSDEDYIDMVIENDLNTDDDESNAIWESGYLQGYRRAIEEAKKFKN